MKERPIMFKAEMVRAILSGVKTQTRRPVKNAEGVHRIECDDDGNLEGIFGTRFNGAMVDFAKPLKCPYGVTGDLLWVRETWKDSFKRTPENNGCSYLADYGYRLDLVSNEQARLNWKWRSAMFMPRWASRITLEIVSVRVERVQSITEEDAIAEGIEFQDDHKDAWRGYRSFDGTCLFNTAKESFTEGWDSIYAKTPYAWNQNPWVWVVEFRRESDGR